MAIDDKTREEKSQCGIKRESQKYQHDFLGKLITVNIILQVKKYCFLIKCNISIICWNNSQL